MIIIIPLGGIGERFKKKSSNPKALINVNEKPIITYLLDNLEKSIIENNIDYILIPYNKEYSDFNLEEFLVNRYKNIKFKFFCLENNTRGAAETIQLGINSINEERDIPVLCLDCDNWYLCDIIKQWNKENCVFSIEDLNNNPIYSYVETDNNKNIKNIKEKEKISNKACTGAYGFSSIKTLNSYITKIITENLTQKSEFYTSGVIKKMITDGHIFKNIEILNKHYFSFGTPEQVEEYENPFIFDLDGTLVITDNIYTLVWNEIMKKYNIVVDNYFFEHFIQGKNDMLFMKELFPNILEKDIITISNIKDSLFIKYLKSYNKNILIDGAKEFINKNKNRRIGIVTSCNRKSAEFILDYTKISDYIQFLIASEDCKDHKPNKEPYQKAINILKCKKEKCTIFEDSNTGYKSALSLGGTKICLVINNNSSNFILNSNEYKVRNYKNIDIEKFFLHKDFTIKKSIKNKLKDLLIKDITIHDNDLKTGYICDIHEMTLTLNNDDKLNVVIKIENQDNELANTANKINLYYNENYFYENISSHIDFNIPKFYSCIEFNNKRSILLENLNNYKGEFNINLTNNIDILLDVIRLISNMHNRFLFNNESEIISIMKPLLKINQIYYYKELIISNYEKFMKNNSVLLNNNHKKILNSIFNKFDILINHSSSFPLSFCHGDLKSPNIFYKNTNNVITPIFLDWQYIHLNKGISDIVFLLVESLEFDNNIVDIVLKYYLYKSKIYKNLDELLFDFKVSLCIFPFFVMIWFGSENRELLLDKVFPIKFMKKTLKYYTSFLDDNFFNSL